MDAGSAPAAAATEDGKFPDVVETVKAGRKRRKKQEEKLEIPGGGAAGWDRTSDPWLRRPILYPLSYSRTGSCEKPKDTGFPPARLSNGATFSIGRHRATGLAGPPERFASDNFETIIVSPSGKKSAIPKYPDVKTLTLVDQPLY
jgi:hypothetical protein